jgi:hypothetical protein
VHTMVERMRDERSCTTCSVAHRELASPVELAKTTASLRARSLYEGRVKNFYPCSLWVQVVERAGATDRVCLPRWYVWVYLVAASSGTRASFVGMHLLPASSRVRLHRVRVPVLSCLMCLQVYVGNLTGKTLYAVRSHLSALAFLLLLFSIIAYPATMYASVPVHSDTLEGY